MVKRFKQPMMLAALVAASALLGCSAGEAPASIEEETVVRPDPSMRSSLFPASRKPTVTDLALLTGHLGADAVEGGCAYLEAADGTRYEVIYPAGWEVRLSPLQLIAPDGDVVAEGGDEVTVTGSVADDMSSICQIGPMWRASEVTR